MISLYISNHVVIVKSLHLPGVHSKITDWLQIFLSFPGRLSKRLGLNYFCVIGTNTQSSHQWLAFDEKFFCHWPFVAILLFTFSILLKYETKISLVLLRKPYWNLEDEFYSPKIQYRRIFKWYKVQWPFCNASQSS